MTLAKHTITATATGLTGGGTYALHVISSSITLDEYAVPYIAGTITCSIPPLATLDLIDPRLTIRLTIVLTTTQTGVATVTRTLNLALTDRVLDFTQWTMTLSVASDEALLDGYALVASTSTRTYGLSVKTAVIAALAAIGATLGGSPADFTLTSKTLDPVLTNLTTNPTSATATTNWAIQGVGTLSRLTGLTIPGLAGVTTAARTTTTSSSIAGIYTGIMAAAVPALAYTYSMWVRSSIAANYSPFIYFYTSGSALIGSGVVGPAVALAANTWTRVSFTATAPASAAFVAMSVNATANVASGTLVDGTAAMAEVGSTAHDYFDGGNATTRDSTIYVPAWTGTANASTSTLTEQPNSDSTIWNPGTSAYDYVAPLVQTGGLRLWCDEARIWHLDTSTTVNSTFVSMAAGTNVTAATETVSLTSGEWYSAVVIQYNWTTPDGLSHIAYDTAGTPTNGRTLYQSYDNTPYPGAGAAAAALTRASNKGRVFSVTGMPNFTVTPTGALLVNLPNDDIQSGITSSVKWSIPSEGDAEMSITSRGLVTVPLHSWITITETTWASIAETTWATLV